MQSGIRRPTLLCAGAALCCLAGCATQNFSWDKDKFPKASARNPVVQIVCLWEQAEGRDPEGVPCRGFAGQIMFLANRHATPVEVEGNVRIYLFDDVGTVEEQSKPIRQYDFDNGAWKLHLTKSAVGPSYSVFVPYVRRGQHNPQCSLRLRLKPKEGTAIFSELSTLPLRGPSSMPETTIISEAASPEERVQAEVNQTLSRVVERSSTIPLNVSSTGALSIAPNPKAPKHAAVPAASSAPQPTQTDARLDRMEKLLEQALAEKAITPRSEPPSVIQQANFETLSEAPAAEVQPPRRFKLKEVESD